ncbi:D-sorbitol dehydrogenase subunit SldA [Neokomagataea thailandica NBRC 106555]|uniref:Membrane-bound PQQ-dependent dehydrogenase, glucose/quinate/shikimate family n=2 Tax=Neokomagataea TaxID=1223423 RepID=A0A4Y6V3T2_9PROT|nr:MULTISPECIES: pyrroloquinoline quinone-dependent dehydrogenase [Neokomagataea]QDH24719.1 membrane-bound PQQ-dependent dehydrogenase, glucose/quinate/shikimate family [Neokomagataea tanensis]GBR53751.1 D-sorbitol dehydrogenase subunit SldA [Neokomagataea thailandica NBRC 106555]
MRISLLAASALSLATCSSFVSPAKAQVASEHASSIPGSSPQEEGPSVNSKFGAPSPFAPQAAGVNAANLPDNPSMDPAEVTPMVPQQSATPAEGDWAAYGRDDDASRYSPLAQITPENVGQLQRAFIYHTGSKPAPGQANKWAAETTPLKVGDGLYMCSATNDMMKLDPATGREIWRFKAGVQFHSIPYTAACKSVVYYTSSTTPEGQPCHNRIVEATLDERLISVDADTGEACKNFGFNGQINLMQGMGESVPGFVSETAPPPIINGVIVTNQEVLDGQRRWAPSGVIRGYDAESGKFLWAWDVNRPNDHSQPAPGEHYSRGTPNSWAAMTGDNALGLVYVPTGNSAADYYSALRTPEENAVSSSIVAIDVKTGSPRWVFQTVHKDVWDYDLGSQATKFDFPTDHGPVPALIVPTKRGETFVLDRATGKPLLPVEERPAPAGHIPGDPRAATQPWSTGMPRLGFPPLKESDMWGMSPIDQLFCRIKFRRARYEGEFTAPSLDKPWIEYPGYNGGSDWGSMAYDAKTGILIANWNNTPMYDQLVTRRRADKLGMRPIDSPYFDAKSGGAEGNGAQADTPYGIVVTPFWDQFTGMMCNKPPYGAITAIDMHTRKVLWQTPLGTARANGPFGLPTYLPLKIGTPNNGGPIITAGGLVFVAAATDNLIRAIDIKTGKTVWSDVLPGGGQATPMTYEYKGRQYIAIMAGGHHFMMTPVTDDLVVYALPKTGN